MHQLMRNIRDIEQGLGDGVKRVYPSEFGARQKLRRAGQQWAFKRLATGFVT